MKTKKRRALSLVIRALSFTLALTFALAGAVLATGTEDEDTYAVPDVSNAPYVYLYNFENDVVLFEKGDLNLPIYPTSTVKIMAGIAAIEALGGDLTREITVTGEMLKSANGNQIGLYEGETVTAEQMLYCMLVNSANDAAIVLAHMVSGSVPDFVQLMNDKAFEIGARATFYTNPTGMHSDSMITTAADTILIAKYAYENPTFMEIVGTGKYVMASTNRSDYRNVYNRNCLMSKHYRSDYFYDYALGMNAGSTVQGGYSSVTVARNADGDLTYLCVIMGASPIESEDPSVQKDLTNYSYAINLFNWALRTYGYRDVLPANKIVCEVPVGLSATADYVTLVPAEKVTVYLPMYVDISGDISITYTVNEDVNAPVTKGEVLGSARVMYAESEIGRAELVATTDISRSEFLFALERIGDFARSRFFIGAVVSAVVLSVLYVLFKARMRQRRLRSRVPPQYRR